MRLATIDPRSAADAPLHEVVAEADDLHGTLYELTRARRRVLWLLALVWLVCAGLFMLPSLVHLHNDLDAPTIISHLVIAVVGMVFSILLLLVIVQLRKLPKRQAFIGSVAGVVAAAAAVATSDIALFDVIHAFFSREHAPHVSYMVKWTSNFAIFTSQFSVIAVTFWMLETLETNRIHQLEIEQVRRIAAEAQGTANRAKLSALRYQLNPHFLFNTLNSISSLVMTRRSRDAEEMLAKLSDFLRTTLSSDPDAAQTLEGELETIDAYLGIERIRFGDRLAMAIDCPAELRDARMPHFLLQPLVENAVKHGVAPCDRPVMIGISARAEHGQLIVSVENDCPAVVADAQGTGVGLRNVRERLVAVYGRAGNLATIEREEGFIALVRLPLEFGEA